VRIAGIPVHARVDSKLEKLLIEVRPQCQE